MALDTPINTITLEKHRRSLLTIAGIVDSVAQTTGPTLFTIVDGSGSLTVKGFEGPGTRAYPQIEAGNAIRATIRVKEFQDALEGEFMKVAKLEGAAAEALKKTIDVAEHKRAEAKPIQFLVKNQLLEKLKPSFLKAATEVRLAVIRNRPIIVRHHNDADGYSAGFAMERAIIPLIVQQHGAGKAPWEYFTRSPSAAPYYEIEDSIKDTADSLRDFAKFSNKIPLVLIVDTGSGEESLLAIRQGKIHGEDFIVVDHHFFEHDVTTPEVLVHINPFVVGEDGARYSAGMLCTELARFINPSVSLDYVPAMSGLADRIDNPEVLDAYIKIAEKKGYTKAFLHDIAALIDFVSTKLRFMEAREYIEVVFGEPLEKQHALVSLMAPYIRKMEARGLDIARSAVKREKLGKTTLQLLFIEETFSARTYPKPGKVNGMMHDEAQTKEGISNLVSVGVLNDVMTIRATESSGFSIHSFLTYLQKHVPSAFVEGGGHKQAGAIKFVPSQREAVLKALKSFLGK